MKHYRSYMDRITAPAGLRQRVLEAAEQGARPRRPARRLTLRLAALSACCVLAVAGGRLLWLGGSAPIPNPPAGMAATPAPAASSPAWEHTLTVGPGPFAEGEAHNFFDIPALNFPDCTDFSPRLTDRDWGVSSFEEKLTAQEIITALGGTGEVPWSLLWEGYGLDGQVFYNEKGDVLQVVITGVRGDDRLRLALSPGRLPPRSVVYQEAATQAVNGIPVTTASFRGQSDGRTLTTCAADFLAGGTGVSFEYLSPDAGQSTWLTEVLAWYGTGADSGFTTEHLNARIHPITGHEPPAEGEAGGGVVVPVPIPSPTPWQVYPLE